MLKNISAIIMVSLLVVACEQSNKPKKPNDLISKDKMSEVLYDLYIINAAKGVNKRLLEKNGVIPETYILTKHNIDSAQFANSNAYYAINTDIYKVIVDQVKERLEKEKKIFEDLEKAEGLAAKKKRDSITALKKRKKDSIKKVTRKDTLNTSKFDSIKSTKMLKKL